MGVENIEQATSLVGSLDPTDIFIAERISISYSAAVQMTAAVPQFSKSNPGPATSRNSIEAESIVRCFGNVTALDRVSLQIREGEFFSLLGPSGCGKTTLLRIIAGLDAPDAGSLSIAGMKAETIPAHQRPVNTVFQNYALFPHLTVWNNVAFGLRMKNVPNAEIKMRVEQALRLVEAADLAHRKPHEISGGQKQRVAVARAVVNEPKVLLLDEPLGALDLKLRKQLQVQLHQLQRRLGITFIHVTHDQEEALVMSDRIALMNAGKIEQLDTAENIYERPRTRFAAEFLGACNVVSGTAKDESIVETPFGAVLLGAAAVRPGTQVSIAIRPEKILIQDPETKRSDQPNVYAGKIEEKIYGGAETQLRIRVGQQLVTVAILNSRSHAHFAQGDSVQLHFPQSALVVLED